MRQDKVESKYSHTHSSHRFRNLIAVRTRIFVLYRYLQQNRAPRKMDDVKVRRIIGRYQK